MRISEILTTYEVDNEERFICIGYTYNSWLTRFIAGDIVAENDNNEIRLV